ncbi:MAG: OmpH family outer membrane protein [Planctomycetota bacterium]|nr:OmpH family outer membrane protein [Planctomycetota bacterium]
MKHLTILILLATISATTFAVGLYAHRDSAEPAEVVRTVDVARILEEFEPFTAAYQTMLAKYKPEVELLKQMNESIKGQRGELVLMDDKSEEFRVRKFEIEVLEKTLATKLDFWNSAQTHEREKLLQMSVSRIYEASAEYGRRSGVGTVLMKEAPLPAAAMDSGNALRDLENRWVIWTHQDHDVTEQVLTILRESL